MEESQPTSTQCETWPMHPIDSRYRGANALSPGDVNQDGFMDYITNYEFDQRYVIAFHPGTGNVHKPWRTIDVWKPTPPFQESGINPEHVTLGDFDGDGNLDVVAAQGVSKVPWWEGSQPGIRIIWGPAPDQVMNENAWKDAGRIPGTIDEGHMIFVTPYDVNGDGTVDIVCGGRIHEINHKKGGVIWIEAPRIAEMRRNLSQWKIHAIDPEQFSAHGLIFNDVDEDGDDDVVLANADWDTPEDEEQVLWYENPGIGSPLQKDPWPHHQVYKGNEFYAKPQVIATDLNQDGFDDLLVQTEHAIYYFKKIGVTPVTWEKITIVKDPITQWLARTLHVADLNNDGNLDIVGMLIHNNSVLPSEKAAVFWMEYIGGEPDNDNWITHVIKWGSGKKSWWPMFGEKWDQADIVDIDKDGDLDIVANCEEWWEDGGKIRPFWFPNVGPATVAVVWFENRLAENPYLYKEVDGKISIEAENYTFLWDNTWIQRANYPGYQGDGYLQDHNTLFLQRTGWASTKGAGYSLQITHSGEYYLWLHRYVPVTWGWNPLLGKGNSNSLWIGIDNRSLDSPVDDANQNYGIWAWFNIWRYRWSEFYMNA